MGREEDEIQPVTDKIIFIRLQGSPIDINIIQVHASTSDHDDDALICFYQKLEEVRDKTKVHGITIPVGNRLQESVKVERGILRGSGL